MTRRLLNLLTVLSLLLCVAVVVLWVRSYVACDRLTWTGDTAVVSVVASKGRSEWSRTTGKAGVILMGEWPWLNHLAADPFDIDAGVWAGLAEGSLPGCHYLQGAPAGSVGVSMQVLLLPHYLPAALALALPAIRAVRHLRARRSRAGACAKCGYDLRATPERCPECGQRGRGDGGGSRRGWPRASRPCRT